MFVPRATRGSRRRQRTGSDDSNGPPKAKRQRSVLRQSGDTTSASLKDNGAEIQPAAAAQSNDYDLAMDPTGGDLHLPFRGAKPSEGPKADSEGTVVLSSTDYYTVNQLPALPDQIRGSQSDPLKCFFAPGQDHALALTHSHAIVWPYSVATSSPSPSETFTVSIPESCRDPYGPVPLGVLLSTATGEHPGLLVMIPSTGRIIYWETVSSAASLALSRQKQYGIQGSTSGMLSGEYAIEIMNCEPSGIIVMFSSGRVAHVTLRDSQGKPSVLVNFLRSSGGNGGGLLGGLKNVLGGGYWRKEVTAVHPGGSRQRGQRDVIVATSTGLVEIWDTHWHHGTALKKKFDVKDEIAASLPSSMKTVNDLDLKILDFAFSTQSSDEQDSDESWSLFVAVSTPQSLEAKTMFIIQLQLSGNDARVQSTYTVSLQSIPTINQDVKPKILVSRPGDTAFIYIGQSLIVLSLTTVDESPTTQLLHDTEKLALPFQDTIHLRSGKEFEILGYGTEERTDDDEEGSSCVMMVRNFGVVRVDVVPQYSTAREVEEGPVTAKHKLEQAIFFGTMAKNPLNLIGDGGLNFPPEEIEQASLEICEELLQSETRFIPSTAISIDQNLRLRAKALSDLASLLSKKGNPLGRTARWELLWGAEKLASQRALWKLEETLRAKNEGLLLGQVIESMNDKFKTRPSGDTDPVRQWFLKDTYQMEHIIPWIKHSIKSRKGSTKQSRKNSEQIMEASELFLSVMETAYRYRDDHASMYGLGDDFVEDGVLADGYETLPEFWTSRRMAYTETADLLDIETEAALNLQQKSTAETPDGQMAKKLASNCSRHLRALGQMHRERVRWLAVQDDSKLLDESVSIEQSFVKDRKWYLFKLGGINQLQDAIVLAERFRDMVALVELLLELTNQVREIVNKGLPRPDMVETPVFGAPAIGYTFADLDIRIAHYFDKFGEPFSDAYFTRKISMGNPGPLLMMRKYQGPLTRFLRKHPAYAKLSWMNDVIGEEDYETAALCLENLAIGNETQLWNRHVQISLAKLSQLAASEKNPALGSTASFQEDISRIDDCIANGEIQDKLSWYIRAFTEGAIDPEAEQELALQSLGGYLAEDRPSLHEILGDALSTLVNRNVTDTDGLIDILTLIGPFENAEEVDSDLCGHEFYQALRVLDRSRYIQQDPSYVSALRKLIWRRCMIKDDWEARGKAAEGVNGDSDSATRDTSLFKTLSSCITEGTDSRHKSLFQPLSPAEAMMAGSESDILVSRFRPEQRARVATDLQREDDILRDYIETGKLDFWYQNLLGSLDPEASNGVNGADASPSEKARLTFV
ncbi:hypothetical protein N7532_006213 [Penicillium argentinense]|uniref:Nuclear pore complex subunit Nup133 n=1 Tax=Penicillium argentinense TaxID=1131581 RepID=A0A9W9KBR5_9EURO|nr:uncharacterized protein N7532_006213 [Penicillium argentinense]KAJ5099212.1 hypothetical protein N7532_006213 [Penicillium argentinense]